MAEVGIREFKQRANEILRRVREVKETFSITYRGKVVARLVPADETTTNRARASAIWTQMDELAREIAVYWPPQVSAAEAVKDQRREL